MKLSSNDGFKLQDFSKSFHHRPHDPTMDVPAGPVIPYPESEDGTPNFEHTTLTQKRSSLRRRRTIFTLSVAAFTVGALLLVLSSPYSHEFLAPGPLHSSHAQLLAGQGADRCAACHDAANSTTAFGWVAHAFSGASHKMTQSELCLKCHKSTINEQFALNPHNIAPSELAEKSGKFKNASYVRNLSTPAVDSNNQIACRACHREHKSELDLQAMTDAQCQTCHQENYHSFETDHPEFTSWPKASSQKIAFDHTTHFGKHFPSKQESFDCNRCHLDDNFQNAKIQAPFEQACASCHEADIVDSGLAGFQFFALPMLDMRAIEDANLQIGSWPASATGTFDGTLPAAMRALLMADENAKAVLLTKPKSFEFTDLDPDDANDVSDAVTLVWSIKRLLHELSVDGPAAMHRRMEIVLQRSIDQDEINKLLNGLDAQSFQSAARRWLPKLGLEVESKFGSASNFGVSDLIDNERWLARTNAQDQLAVNPLKQLDDSQNQGPITGSVAKSNDLGTLELPDLVTSGAAQEASSKAKQSRTDKPRRVLNPNVRAAVAKRPTPIQVPTEVPIFAVSRKGSADLRTGWIRDDGSLSILYRPTGHEDAFLKNWIDAVVTTPNADADKKIEALLHSLTNENAVGNCRYCHTLKRKEDRSFEMNWAAVRRDASIGSFTSFSHRPHLIQPGLQDCSHCHRLDPAVSNNETFASVDQSDYRSNFHWIQKATCTKCHQKGLTNNSCTMCHDYHIGSQKTR